jgi:hypothetical protein
MEEAETVPRRVQIRKDEMERFGYTANCPGCTAAIWETARQVHTEACRKRFGGEMKDMEKTQNNMR